MIPGILGPYVLDRELLDARVETCEVVATKSAAVNQPLRELNLAGESGCYASKLIRSQIELPRSGDTVLQKGDTLFLTGVRDQVQAAAGRIGEIGAALERTDLLTFPLGIVLGLVLGQIKIKMGHIGLELGQAGGLLIAGIAVGFLHSMYPTFGQMPGPARWAFREMGLLFFLASVGLRAGAGIEEEFVELGPILLFGGAVVTLVTPLVPYLFGLWVLKMNPALLLGSICGAMTSTPALGLIQAEAKSEVPSLGYAGTYTFANVLLTLAGTLMMRL